MELSRTFVFQNAAVSTSPVGAEGKRRGRCVGYHSRMSDAEIDRIFRSLDRIEARLLKLEEREAMRRGSDMTKTQLVAIIATISAVTGCVTAVVSQLI